MWLRGHCLWSSQVLGSVGKKEIGGRKRSSECQSSVGCHAVTAKKALFVLCQGGQSLGSTQKDMHLALAVFWTAHMALCTANLRKSTKSSKGCDCGEKNRTRNSVPFSERCRTCEEKDVDLPFQNTHLPLHILHKSINESSACPAYAI